MHVPVIPYNKKKHSFITPYSVPFDVIFMVKFFLCYQTLLFLETKNYCGLFSLCVTSYTSVPTYIVREVNWSSLTVKGAMSWVGHLDKAANISKFHQPSSLVITHQNSGGFLLKKATFWVFLQFESNLDSIWYSLRINIARNSVLHSCVNYWQFRNCLPGEKMPSKVQK